MFADVKSYCFSLFSTTLYSAPDLAMLPYRASSAAMLGCWRFISASRGIVSLEGAQQDINRKLVMIALPEDDNQ